MAGTGQGFQNIKWLEIKKSQAILKRFIEPNLNQTLNLRIYKEGCKGGGPTHESRKLKSRNNSLRGLKFRVHVSREFPK